MDLSLQLAQKQMLSQRMQQSAEILQMNTLALSEYARELAEENPLLEWKEEEVVSPEKDDKLLRKLEWLEEADEQNRSYYRVEQEEEREENRFSQRSGESLREYLLFQINILKVTACKKCVLRFLAESTEESGYLEQGALEAATQKYNLKESTVRDILGLLQKLDPPGVGARTLSECLQIQLRQNNGTPLAIIMVEKHLEDLAKNRMGYVAKRLKVSLEEAMDAFDEIKRCEPKPGRGFLGGDPVEYVVPDVTVEKLAGELLVSTNSAYTPRLFISQTYLKILREGASREAETYISNKMKQAEWALQCISKRESTLLETAKAIVAHQHDFFENCHGQLRPLRMADIAETLAVHESTVSRAVKDKYLQCDRGVFAMNFFFSKALGGEGTEVVSADSIQQKVRRIIEKEDKKKPLSDREITEGLQGEGVQISRRTVAKYREAMGIMGASGRKQY